MKRCSRSPHIVAAVLALSLAGIASAQTPAAAPEPPAPDWTFSSNVGLFSEYIFRGIAQTAGKPAVQGGFDLAHSSGFYAGTWASNVSWLEDFNAYNRSSVEWDFYAGFKHASGDSDGPSTRVSTSRSTSTASARGRHTAAKLRPDRSQ